MPRIPQFLVHSILLSINSTDGASWSTSFFGYGEAFQNPNDTKTTLENATRNDHKTILNATETIIEEGYY
ncbi:hypothetical protein KSZ_60390 [Dictyobacter formicarum]|uniref:Uncharacterized protein n=1 Tax=Dictyobacter formicarum TaxID=2778368 RepID=A0ABQ3VQA9_9CHLR|nr:hypothetical protein KSZ_60390 [Dictyobacter formicarum]